MHFNPNSYVRTSNNYMFSFGTVIFVDDVLLVSRLINYKKGCPLCMEWFLLRSTDMIVNIDAEIYNHVWE